MKYVVKICGNGYFKIIYTFVKKSQIHQKKYTWISDIIILVKYIHVLFCIFQVYVLQDTELMKFVFNRDPTTVQRKLPEFKSQLEGAFAQPYKFNIYDTEFYSKVDGSLDFGRTRYEIKKKYINYFRKTY